MRENSKFQAASSIAAESEKVCQLRMLSVEPKAHSLGLGNRLVGECIHFAKEVSYKKITLLNNGALADARHIYEKTEFHIVKKETKNMWGYDQINEFWEMDL